MRHFLALRLIAQPGLVFADNNNGHADMDDVAAAQAAAASAAGAAAFQNRMRQRRPPPNLPEYSGPQGQDVPRGPPKLKDFDLPPKPWWKPDGWDALFGN